MQSKSLTKVDKILTILSDPDDIEYLALVSGLTEIIEDWVDIMYMAASIHRDHSEQYEYLDDLYERSLRRDYSDDDQHLLVNLARRVYTLTLGVAGDKVTINHVDDWHPYGYERIPLDAPGYTVKSWDELDREMPQF